MTRLTKVLFTSALSIAAMAGTALADDPPADPPAEGEGGGGTEAGAGGEASAGGEAGGATVDASMAVGVDVGEIGTPYTNDKGKLKANVDLLILKINFSDGDPMTPDMSFSQQHLGVGAGYGVTDKITAGGSYVFPVAGDGVSESSSTGKGEFSLFGMFNLAQSAKMHVAAGAEFSIDMCGKFEDGECAVGDKAINAGLGLKYLVAPKVAVFTGAPYGPVFFGGNPGQHLAISLEEGNITNFSLPVGVGLQAIPKLYAYVQTNLAVFRLKKADGDEGDTVIPIGKSVEDGGLGVPLNIGGLFGATPQIDAALNLIFPDVTHAGDIYAITIGGRYKM